MEYTLRHRYQTIKLELTRKIVCWLMDWDKNMYYAAEEAANDILVGYDSQELEKVEI
jgi:hypothetical protein